MLEKLTAVYKTNETGPLSYTTDSNELKCNKDLNIRPETINSEGNMGGKLLDISLGDDKLLDLTPKAKATKAKINK